MERINATWEENCFLHHLAEVRSPGVERRTTNHRAGFVFHPPGEKASPFALAGGRAERHNLNYFPGGVFRWFVGFPFNFEK